jgi:hypothetical protein
MKHLLTVLLFSLSNQVFSQEDISEEEPKKEKPVEKGKFDWEKNFYLALSTTTYLDVVRSPLRMVNVWVGENPDGSNKYVDVPYQTFSWSLFSLGIEPRVNLKTFSENHAFAVSMPLSIGVSQSSPSQNDVRGTEGFGSIQVPFYAKMYLGHGSTYDSEKEYGVSFGAGLEYNKLALLPNKFDEETTKGNKGWVMPVFTIGIHFWRMSNPVEINFKYGAGKPKEYYVNGEGELLSAVDPNVTSRAARSSSFKLSFVYLMNY